MHHRCERGSALIIAVVSMTLAIALAAAALSLATDHRSAVERVSLRAQARSAAEAGVHRAVQRLQYATRRNPWNPLAAVDRLLFDSSGDPIEAWVAEDEMLRDGARTYAGFRVKMWGQKTPQGRQIVVTSTGYAPNPESPAAHETVRAVVEIGEQTAKIFENSYFVNNWGWMFGDTIRSYGNVRSNGQFAALGSAAEVHGAPRYERLQGTSLIGYQDDNSDGLRDGLDGGVYSGWEISGSENLVGTGGVAKNQLSSQAAQKMPNLQNLDTFEQQAHSLGSSIHLGGQLDANGDPAPPLKLAGPVLGEGSGTPQNLVLIGTPSEPIILDGPVVVRGDVIILGTVTGQGAIYAGRNVYVAGNLNYLDGPGTDLPSSNSQADTQAWLNANAGKDFLALHAREQIVMGDHRDSRWQSQVGGWLDHALNESGEDVGADGVPFTRAGRDAVQGTEDDDLLEGDMEWTVEHYSAEDDQLGLIPAGFAVGDAIPGTGEDVDGDGTWDAATQLSDFELDALLSESSQWAGNLPASITDYSQIATNQLTRVDASLSTSHAVAMMTQAAGQDFRLFGSLSCRTESIIYETDHLDFVHDRRLLGGSLYPTLLPRTLSPIRIRLWKTVDTGTVDTVDAWF